MLCLGFLFDQICDMSHSFLDLLNIVAERIRKLKVVHVIPAVAFLLVLGHVAPRGCGKQDAERHGGCWVEAEGGEIVA